MKLKLLLFVLLSLINIPIAFGDVSGPMPVDSRIKTLIYSPNEIFQIRFMVNYQSMIELEKDEEIELISWGDPIPWSTKVLTRRIFIKALDPGVKTNMTLITNKRTYLMEISSTNSPDELDDRVAFIVRFFYPSTNVDLPKTNPNKGQAASIQVNELATKALAMTSNKLASANDLGIAMNPANFNGDYSYSGEDKILIPDKVFDDGIRTFFKFKKELGKVPQVFSVDENGAELLLDTNKARDLIYVNNISNRFAIREGGKIICIFNNQTTSNDGKVYVKEKK